MIKYLDLDRLIMYDCIKRYILLDACFFNTYSSFIKLHFKIFLTGGDLYKKKYREVLKIEFTRSHSNYCNDYPWNYFWQKKSKIKHLNKISVL